MTEKEFYLTVKEEVLQEMERSRELSDRELRYCIEEKLQEKDKSHLLSFQKRKLCMEAVFASFRKFGALQELIEDEGVTEILVNGPMQIFYEKV